MQAQRCHHTCDPLLHGAAQVKGEDNIISGMEDGHDTQDKSRYDHCVSARALDASIFEGISWPDSAPPALDPAPKSMVPRTASK